MTAVHNLLTCDRAALTAFADALFRYADPGTVVSVRSFKHGEDKPIDIRDVDIGSKMPDAIMSVVIAAANYAANYHEPAVFCPPVATFLADGEKMKGGKTKASNSNVANGLALSVECDARPGAARERLERLLGPVTVVVASGGMWTDPETGEVQPKVHLHWRLTEPTRIPECHARLHLARTLATRLVDGDPSNQAIVHPLRWPGSWHRKAEPRLATIEALNESVEVDLDEAIDLLTDACRAAGIEARARKSRQADAGPATRAGDAKPAEVAAALALIPNPTTGDNGGDWDRWNRIGMAAWRATGGSLDGFTAWDTWSAKHTRYDAEATAERWEHFAGSPPTVVGMQTLIYEARKADPDFMRPKKDKARAFEDVPHRNTWARAGRPTIKVVAGDLPRCVDEGEGALLAAGLDVYQRGPFIVRPANIPIRVADGRAVTVPRLVEVNRHAMRELLTLASEWEKFDGRSEAWVRCDAPVPVVDAYLARAGRWTLPPLAGLINAPTLRRDGTILDRPGYDAASGLLFDPGNVAFPVLPAEPTRDDAIAALKVLDDLVETFPFVDAADRSVALSAILTALGRKAIDTAPLHAFTAPTAGSGKSMLVDLASIIATGHPAPVLAQGKTEEEMEKRLGSALLAGDAIVAIDNCELPLGGELLCQALTQTSVKVRVLGRSETPTLPSDALMTATGNNLTLVGDMTRRSILCRLDPGVERPELRRFEVNPLAMVRESRGLYVAAGLTVLRAFHVAGRPRGADPLGSFETWSTLVRDALLWLGRADPCGTMDDVRASDPKLKTLTGVISLWAVTIGERRVSAKDVIDIATQREEALYGKGEFKHPEFREILLEVAGDAGAISGRRLGKWLGANKNRLVAGFRICDDGLIGGTQKWRLKSP
jgi:putative DNA primase/helicase